MGRQLSGSDQCICTLYCCPTPASVASGVLDGWLVNGQTSPLVWMPGSGDGVVGDERPVCVRFERGAGRDERRAGPAGTLRWETGLPGLAVQAGRVVARFDVHYANDNVDNRAGHATTALAMPLPAPPSGTRRGRPREVRGSRRAAVNLARLRPHRDRRGGAVAVILPNGDGVPVQQPWPASHCHTEEGERPPDACRNQPGPCGGEASRCANVTDQPAASAADRRAWEEAPVSAVVHPAHARHSQSTRRTPAVSVGRGLSACLPSVPGSRSA